MPNHFPQILQQYFSESQCEPEHDEPGSVSTWVLASLIEKHGSSYRKAGAMMMVSPNGQALGGLSGGCLERDIIQQAYQASVGNTSRTVIYDTRDPEDSFLRHQTGCQGLIHILFTPIDARLHQQLSEVYQQLQNGAVQYLALSIEPKSLQPSLLVSRAEIEAFESFPHDSDSFASYQTIKNESYSVIQIKPAKHLLVIGGGYDAEPLVKMAKDIGWQVTVWDDRLHYAKESNFKYADNILRFAVENQATIKQALNDALFDAAVLMTHHLGKDAAWLSNIASELSHIAYLGMIGPLKRQAWVAEICQSEFNVELDAQWLQQKVHSPAGFDIGGDTPESIALSILAQAHQQLCK